MVKVSGYVKRFKSLSLLIFGVALVTYDAFESGKKLDSDFFNAQKLFFIAALVQSEVPENGGITRVDGVPVSQWLRQRSDILPTSGSLVDLIHLWEIPLLRVDGELYLSNSETIEFIRWPDGIDEVEVDYLNKQDFNSVQCKLAACTGCVLYTVFPNNRSSAINITLLRSENHEQAARYPEETWLYFDDVNDKFINIKHVKSKLSYVITPWIGLEENVESAYLKLRDKRQQRMVRIPVINFDVKASSASIFLSLFSLIVSALMTHSLFSISSSPVQFIEEPWILQIIKPSQENWLRKLQQVLSFSSGCVIIGVTCCPIVITIYAIIMSQTTMLMVLQSIMLVVTCLLVVASIWKLILIMKETIIGSE